MLGWQQQEDMRQRCRSLIPCRARGPKQHNQEQTLLTLQSHQARLLIQEPPTKYRSHLLASAAMSYAAVSYTAMPVLHQCLSSMQFSMPCLCVQCCRFARELSAHPICLSVAPTLLDQSACMACMCLPCISLLAAACSQIWHALTHRYIHAHWLPAGRYCFVAE
jgi:hypothetical protein